MSGYALMHPYQGGEHGYLKMLRNIRTQGRQENDRTGVGTLSVFGGQLLFDLTKWFPLLTTKKVFFRGVVEELLWMLRGETNVKSLQAKGIHIWDEWADKDGELGPVYGEQWRAWVSVDGDGEPWYTDQISDLIENLKKNPFSRRHIVTAWNPATVDLMKLPPCHMMFQFDVEEHKVGDTSVRYLNCQLYQRSADMFLGVPFNIASYALLVHIIAREVGMYPGYFVHTFGNAHIYRNHLDAVDEQLKREPSLVRPTLRFHEAASTWDKLDYRDFILEDYLPQGEIKAPVAV